MPYFVSCELSDKFKVLDAVLNSSFILNNAKISDHTLWNLRHSNKTQCQIRIIDSLGLTIDLAIKELLDLRDFFDVD